jgi:hypothetical protein
MTRDYWPNILSTIALIQTNSQNHFEDATTIGQKAFCQMMISQKSKQK